MEKTMKKKTGFTRARRRETIFYTAIVVLPLLQFAVFYIYANLNAFLMAFERYNLLEGKMVWVGLQNFEEVVRDLSTPNSMLQQSLKTSIILFVLNELMLPLGWFVPFYLWKKLPGSEFFKIVLYIPSVLSGMVLALSFQYIADQVIPELALELFGKTVSPLLQTAETRFMTLFIHGQIIGMGSGLLLNLSILNRIPESLKEYTQLEGCGPVREYFTITLPMIFPTMAIFVYTGLSGFYTNQMNLYTYFGTQSTSLTTLGYYTFANIMRDGQSVYGQMTAVGLFFTIIMTPIILFVKWLCDKVPDVQF